MTDLIPNDLSYMSDADFNALCPQGHHAPGPEPLSPVAQVVLDAFRTSHTGQGCLAAALRAAAQTEYKPDMRDEMEVMFSEGWNSHRKELLSIADELEGAND